MQIQWTDLAAGDLDSIQSYIAEDNSPGVAVEVVLKVLDSVELVLSNHPGAGRTGRVKGTKELVLDGVPFTVVYRLHDEGNEIQVLRVLHDAQSWPSP